MQWPDPSNVVLPMCVPVALVLALPAAASIDLTGKWQVEYENASTEFIDVTDTAGAVSLTLNAIPGNPGATLFTGSFSEPSLSLSLSVPGCVLPTCFQTIEARVLANGDYFDGRLVDFDGTPPPDVHRVLAHRCECFDGNAADGDGCDASCRIEPCFTCVGMPSTCSPTGDGGACSDGSPCTTGETCSAGVCGGGTPVTPCVDISGAWDTTTTSDFFGPLVAVTTVEQHGDVVLFRGDGFGDPGFFGTIALATGDFTLEKPELGILLCTGSDTMSGTTGLNTYSASGEISAELPTSCFDAPFTQTGKRQCPGGCPPIPAVPPTGGLVLAVLLAVSAAGLLWGRAKGVSGPS